MSEESSEEVGEDSPALVEHAPRVFRDEFNAMRSVASLMTLAGSGDERALHALHKLARVSTRFLNDTHPNFAAHVVEWPVMIPREKRHRDKCLESASAMRIGGVKGGGVGRPDKLTGDSQKGFALLVLERIGFVRAVVRSIGVASLRNELAHALGETGAADCSDAMLEMIGALDEYSPETRETWIDAGCEMLLVNRDLIPASIAKASTDESIEFDAKGGKRKHMEPHARGFRAAILKALTEGLSAVSVRIVGARES
jgi:hypothetical protein